jgi:prepilin-type N-terminal cleavage/methylation domain-containing protein/prepilin-type processing-associated H-X9-DG protein
MRKGFTLIELLVVIAIIAILAAILFPVLLQAKQAGYRASCVSNVRQIGYAIKAYQESFNGCYPSNKEYNKAKPWGHSSWIAWLIPYTKSKKVFSCPGAGYPCHVSDMKVGYSYNEYIFYQASKEGWTWFYATDSSMPAPHRVALVADGYLYTLFHDWNDGSWPNMDGLPSGMVRIKYADVQDPGSAYPKIRHGGTNILFCDLHARFYAPSFFKAVDFPGVMNPTTCRECPIVYPGAQPY